MSGLRFGVLGPLEVHRDAVPVPVPPGRRRAVLACLVMHAGRPVPAEVLIEAAWGDDLPRDPRASLNTVLSRLRSLLGPDAMCADPAGHRLSVPGGIDAREFEDLCRQAVSASPAEAVDLLHRALGLWRGPAYAEFADREFASVEATRLDQMRLDAVEAHAEAASDIGDMVVAIDSLESLLAEHPYRERAVELLLVALYRAGRQTEALERYRDYRDRLVDELGLEPSPSLRDVEARILGHAVGPPGSPSIPDVPSWLDTSTAFIGRDDAMAELIEAIANNRVVTVTGVGGVGKSRLAAEALPSVSARVRLPIKVAELAPVSPGGVLDAVADALGLRYDATPTVADVVEYLSVTGAVVVLDNCEHLLEEVSALVGTLARRCAPVRTLATSRHRLGLPSELVLPLAPLAVPPAGADVERQRLAPALRLFADRMRRLSPACGITADNAAEAAEICRRLDGLPLAVELAASRAATIGVPDLRERLVRDRVTAVSGDLSGVVEWSYRLLTERQRRLLNVLSVFVGEFDPHCVQAVARQLDPGDDDITDTLAELAEASLVLRRESGGAMSYRLLEFVRAFAAQRLAESGETNDAHQAHALWVRDLTREAARDWPRCDGAVVGAQLDEHRDEITAAVEWALRSGHTAIAADTADAMATCLHWTPSLRLSLLITESAERILQDPDPALAHGVASGAFFAAERGELERARRLAHAALDMSGTPGRPVNAWLALGVAAIYAGDQDEAKTCFDRIAQIPAMLGEANTTLALIACFADDLATARDHAAVALAAGPSGSDASHAFAQYAAGEVMARTDPAGGADLLTRAAAEGDRVGARQVSRVARVALFALLVREERFTEAAELGGRLVQDLLQAGLWPQMWTTLRVTAELLAATGRHAEAAVVLAAADAAPSAPPLMGEDIQRYAELRREMRDRLGESVVDRLGELATGLPRRQVVDRATALLAGVPQLEPSTRADGAPQ